MSIDFSSLADDVGVWVSFLVNLIMPVLPIVLGLTIGAFVIGVIFALPRLLGKMKIG